MKNAVLVLALLGAFPAAAAAQSEFVWVTNRGSNTVAVYDIGQAPAPTTALVSIPLGGDPYGIVGIPSARRVYVSFSVTGTRVGRVAVIDADTYQVVNVIPIPDSVELRRMCASRDETRIYVTGRHQTNTTGAVWKLDLTTGIDNPAVQFIDEVPGSIGPAQDVTEVVASAVGGVGNGPGKIFYTIPQGTGNVGIFNFVTSTPTAVVVPLTTTLHWGVDRAPDDSFVVVGVNETAIGQWKILQITSLNDAANERQVGSITFASRIWDVAFVQGAAGPDFPIHMLGLSGGNYAVFTRSINGSGFVAGTVQSGTIQPPNLRTLVLHEGASETRLYMGNDAPASIAFGRSPNPVPGAGGWNPDIDGGTTAHVDPTDFAFMLAGPRPRPAVTCPKGDVNQAATEIVVRGTNFLPGAIVQLQGGAGPVSLPTTFIDSTTLRASQSATGGILSVAAAVSGNTPYTLAAPAPSWLIAGVSVTVTGCANAANNGSFTVFAVAGSVVTLNNAVGVAEPADSPGIATAFVSVGLAENRVIVMNPDGQTGELLDFYAACDPTTTPYSIALPPAGQGYRMVSFPAYYTKARLRQAFAASLGPYNRSRYRVFFWNLNRYVEITEPDEEMCDLAGGAFWVITRFGATLNLDAVDARSNHTSADMRVIPLKPGWNLISNPFVNPPFVNKGWSTVNVTADGEAWTGAAPANTSPLLSPLFTYVNGSYQVAPTMVAGRGYFVKNIAPGPQMLYLLVDTTVTKASSSSEPTTLAVPSGAELPPGPPGGMGEDEGSGCGLSGLEAFLLLAVYQLVRRRRTLAG